MSFDEKMIEAIAAAAARAHLEFILIGNAAAALHDVPVITQDVDLFVRYTPRNLEKIKAFGEFLGGSVSQPYDPLSRMMRLVTDQVSVDFVFGLSSRRKFESVRSRALRIKLGRHEIKVASLEDIIAAKEAANRPKDRATLHVLKNTLRVKCALKEEQAKYGSPRLSRGRNRDKKRRR